MKSAAFAGVGCCRRTAARRVSAGSRSRTHHGAPRSTLRRAVDHLRRRLGTRAGGRRPCRRVAAGCRTRADDRAAPRLDRARCLADLHSVVRARLGRVARGGPAAAEGRDGHRAVSGAASLHLVLAAPTGRLGSPTARAVVATLYVVTAVVSIGEALLRDPFLDRYCWSNCTDNVFLVRPEQEKALAADGILLAVVAGAMAVVSAGGLAPPTAGAAFARLCCGGRRARRCRLPCPLRRSAPAGPRREPVSDLFRSSLPRSGSSDDGARRRPRLGCIRRLANPARRLHGSPPISRGRLRRDRFAPRWRQASATPMSRWRTRSTGRGASSTALEKRFRHRPGQGRVVTPIVRDGREIALVGHSRGDLAAEELAREIGAGGAACGRERAAPGRGAGATPRSAGIARPNRGGRRHRSAAPRARPARRRATAAARSPRPASRPHGRPVRRRRGARAHPRGRRRRSAHGPRGAARARTRHLPDDSRRSRSGPALRGLADRASIPVELTDHPRNATRPRSRPPSTSSSTTLSPRPPGATPLTHSCACGRTGRSSWSRSKTTGSWPTPCRNTSAIESERWWSGGASRPSLPCGSHARNRRGGHHAHQEGIVRLLGEAKVEVVAEVEDAEALIRQVRLERPDVAIVDIRMPPTHTDEGLVAAQQIRRELPSRRASPPPLRGAKLRAAAARGTAGAGRVPTQGTRLRYRDPHRRAEAITDGESVVDPTIVSRLLGRKRRDDPLADLTPRERGSLVWLRRGSRTGRSQPGCSSPHVRSKLT